MSDGDSAYNIGAVRRLLCEAFTAAELRRFCEDRPAFRPVALRFGPGDGLEEMVDEVIGYCRTRLLFGELLSEIQQYNPKYLS
jgi:hypothetical protein